MKILSINEFLNSKNLKINESKNGAESVILYDIEFDDNSSIFTGSDERGLEFTIQVKKDSSITRLRLVYHDSYGYDDYVFDSGDENNGLLASYRDSGVIGDDRTEFCDLGEQYFPYGYEIKSGTIKFYIKKDTFIDLVKSECSLGSAQMTELLNTNPDTNKNSIWNKCLVKLVNDYFCINTLNIYFDYVIRNHEKTLCNSTGVEYKEESEFNSFLNDEIIVDGDVNIDCPHIIDGINEFFDDSIDDSVDRYNEELGY